MPSDTLVHVVDDDLAVRRALAFLLATDGLAVRVHESASAFLATVAEPTGCIVTDVRMPEIDGIEFLRRLRQRGPMPPVIVMTGHADVPLAVAAMKEGARDFIEKPFDDEVLLASVRSALAHAERSADRAAETKAVRTRLAILSERERDVLDGLVAGKANKVIALDLGISPRTVEIYRANVMAKLQAGSLSELVRMALVAGQSSDGC
ncbi:MULTISPECIES: response regulator FixJ [Methylobacterium]|jgi:two-component system, LuxR family, response regulator FixJ|uniref:Response regulator FixJ n=1 Tax=Methylobacterium aquaticum TaxID=270351 RepID=A0A0C6G0J5_9HYPH|nr:MULTISPECIES: response regulator FixJ [Methylobacterium]NGM38787.1 response regulator transcription factor FixJ [Methylobacterium sp. DB0501]BAQ49250.1 response regulator FixJ [Methylobacterium aquaticum]